MYKEEEFNRLDNAAEWKEITKDEYIRYAEYATFKDIQLTNLYERKSLDSECTEWTGILRYHESSNVPWLKYTKSKSGKIVGHFYVNEVVLNV